MSTSALEGTYAPFQDVLEADVAEDGAESSPAVREVLNYVQVAEFALDVVRDRPITLNLLSGLQRTLVRGTPGETTDAGRIRQVQVVIGPEGSPVEEARYVPPPPGDQLEVGCRDWEVWIESDHGFDPVVAAAYAHYQFEALHPFTTGMAAWDA